MPEQRDDTLAQRELERGVAIPAGVELGAVHQRPRVVNCAAKINPVSKRFPI